MTEAVTTPKKANTGCKCGNHDDSTPRINVLDIPHQIRHATLHGAFDAIGPDASLILVAPHAPIPLLRELSARYPIEVDYLQEGPTEWHVLVTRK